MQMAACYCLKSAQRISVTDTAGQMRPDQRGASGAPIALESQCIRRIL